MTEDEVRKVITFVRSHQPSFKMNGKGDYDCSLYNRRSELLKGSAEYDAEMDEVYVRGYIDQS